MGMTKESQEPLLKNYKYTVASFKIFEKKYRNFNA